MGNGTSHQTKESAFAPKDRTLVVAKPGDAAEDYLATAGLLSALDAAEETAVQEPVPSLDDTTGSAVDVDEYNATLERCAELEEERQALLRMKGEVLRTIAQFTPIFEDDDCESDEPGAEPEASQSGDATFDQVSVPAQAKVAPTLADFQEVLAEQQELEDEVQSLKEALAVVAVTVSNVSQKSLDLSDHLQDVVNEDKGKLPREASPTAADDLKSAKDCSEISAPPSWQVISKALLALSKPKLEGLKPLCFKNALGIASGASSSTATPRSESACNDWCEA